MLSDSCILDATDHGEICIDPPLTEQQLQPASVDVRVGSTFRMFNVHKHQMIDPRADQDDLTYEIDVDPGEALSLHPGQFVLATTMERLTLSARYSARLEGKSSLGRLGLMTHSTAGFIDPGFSGQITLELSNVANLPIMIWPGMAIGQLCFFRLTSKSLRPYGSAALGSKYQDQQGPTASRSHMSFVA